MKIISFGKTIIQQNNDLEGFDLNGNTIQR